MIIAPSLLAAPLFEVPEILERLESRKNIWAHLDLMDGHFVPNFTYGAPFWNSVRKKTNLFLDAHFMVDRPAKFLQLKGANTLDSVTVHWECISSSWENFLKNFSSNFSKIGVAIKPKTRIDELPDAILEKISLLLIMSVEPGFSGQGFISGSEKKVAEAYSRRKRLGLDFLIQVDGGINLETAILMKEAGSDIFVVGSYLFGADGSFISQLEKLEHALS